MTDVNIDSTTHMDVLDVPQPLVFIIGWKICNPKLFSLVCTSVLLYQSAAFDPMADTEYLLNVHLSGLQHLLLSCSSRSHLSYHNMLQGLYDLYVCFYLL